MKPRELKDVKDNNTLIPNQRWYLLYDSGYLHHLDGYSLRDAPLQHSLLFDGRLHTDVGRVQLRRGETFSSSSLLTLPQKDGKYIMKHKTDSCLEIEFINQIIFWKYRILDPALPLRSDGAARLPRDYVCCAVRDCWIYRCFVSIIPFPVATFSFGRQRFLIDSHVYR